MNKFLLYCPNIHKLSPEERLLKRIYDIHGIVMEIIIEAPGLIIYQCPVCGHKLTQDNSTENKIS